MDEEWLAVGQIIVGQHLANSSNKTVIPFSLPFGKVTNPVQLSVTDEEQRFVNLPRERQKGTLTLTRPTAVRNLARVGLLTSLRSTHIQFNSFTDLLFDG